MIENKAATLAALDGSSSLGISKASKQLKLEIAACEAKVESIMAKKELEEHGISLSTDAVIGCESAIVELQSVL
jgi:hypothetical protein